MPLTAGSRHGVYPIGEPIGKGGMGEVFLARDTRLQRDAAVKVLPAAIAHDASLRVRFEREARSLAALNHPNIAQVYGLEEWEGMLAIAMEYVPGVTLRDRMKQGPLPVDEALGIARQIAAALEAAHEVGVVHRDLKPANVKITPEGTVKLLDFGLAKSPGGGEAPAAGPTPVDAATMTAGATFAGAVMGTPGYMAPEQVRGTHVDKRADIWAFGVVLWEMLAGRRLFAGANHAETLAATLESRIDWTALPAAVPPGIRALLPRCLALERKNRLRDIGDAWLVVDEYGKAAAPAEARGGRTAPWLWFAAGIALAGLAAGLWLPRAAPARPAPLRRFDVHLGSGVDLPMGTLNMIALSPRGERIAFASTGGEGVASLYSRRLDQPAASLLTGTERAQQPFFSPDGEWIGFFAGNALKRVRADGGGVTVLVSGLPRGQHASADWSEDRRIVASLGSALVVIPESGGAPQPLTKLGEGEHLHAWPQWLPGGKTVLFTSHKNAYIESGTIESVNIADGRRTVLRRDAAIGRYLAAPVASGARGMLTWFQQGTQFAAAMDPAGTSPADGPAIPLLEDVAVTEYSAWGALIAHGADGAAIYVARRPPPQTQLAWLERSGQLRSITAKPDYYTHPVLSPDGKRLAYLLQSGDNRDIWVHELDRGLARRVTMTPDNEYVLQWTHDGQWIFHSLRNQLRVVRADGGGEPFTIHENKSSFFLHAVSPDGRSLAFCEPGPDTANDLWTATVEGGLPGRPSIKNARVFQASPFQEIYAGFSPDGQWLAFSTNESGRMEVYVRPYPEGAGKYQVSSEGGVTPVWSPNGRELFFRTPENRIAVVDYRVTGGALSFSRPRIWSERAITGGANVKNFSLAPDGRRFVVTIADDAKPEPRNRIVLLENYTSEIARRMAAK